MIEVFIFVLILLLSVMWFTTIEYDKRLTARPGKININRYRTEYIYGEIAKKLSLGRGKLRELTPENVNIFAITYDNTDIFWSPLAYRSLNDGLYDNPRWGDAYFIFKTNIDDIYTESEIDLISQVLHNARRLAVTLMEEYGLPEWSIKFFFTGEGFDILVSAAAMGVEPREDLCQIYREFRDFMVEKHGIEFLEDDVYGYRSMIRCPNTINGRLSTRVPRYKIELSLEEFMSFSIREMDLLSRRSRKMPPRYAFEHRVDNLAHSFYMDIVSRYEDKVGSSNGYPLLQNGNSEPIRPCIKRLLQEGAPPEDIKESTKTIVAEFKRMRLAEDAALTYLKKWIERFCDGQELICPELVVSYIYTKDDGAYLDLCDSDKKLIQEKCAGKDNCVYFSELLLEEEREKLHDEALFELKGWPLELGPIRSAVYRALIVFESKYDVLPGNAFVLQIHEFAAYLGLTSPKLAERYLRELKNCGLLIEYEAVKGMDSRIKVRRQVPIPD